MDALTGGDAAPFFCTSGSTAARRMFMLRRSRLASVVDEQLDDRGLGGLRPERVVDLLYVGDQLSLARSYNAALVIAPETMAAPRHEHPIRWRATSLNDATKHGIDRTNQTHGQAYPVYGARHM